MSNKGIEVLTDHHILLDMDGVLSNFIGGVERLFDVDMSGLTTWNIRKALNALPEREPITAEQFWETIQSNPRFWADLEPYPWARDVVNWALEKTKGNMTIVTSPDMAVSTYSQKAYWVNRHFPSLMRKLFIGPEKHLMAKPKHILIDDSDSNVEKFIKHGGIGVTFPQPWNEARRAWEPGTVIQNLNYLIQLNVTSGAELN